MLRGAEYRPATTIADRFAEARSLLEGAAGALVYLYVPELDQAAHAHGWESDKWLAILEQLDAELAAFERRMPRGTGLLVTADHGVIDVPAHRHVFVDARPDLLDGVRHVGGEPRFLSLYFEPGLDESARATLLAGWREAEEHRAWVVSRDEAIAAGVYGPVADEVRPRIGDVLIAARAGIAYYDRREPNRQAEAMIGQHGSLSDEETRVPLVRGGAYATGLTRLRTGTGPRLTCGFGSRSGRSCRARIAAYQRTRSALSSPNFALILRVSRKPRMTTSATAMMKNAHRARMPIVCTCASGMSVSRITRNITGMSTSPMLNRAST